MQDLEDVVRRLDAMIVVQVGSAEWVYEWRAQAERNLRKREGAGRAMTEEQLREFVSRFMPAYEAYLPQLYSAPGELAPHVLTIEIDKQRAPQGGRAFHRAANL
eukprot:CAMPEP_0185840652 /NCGR_PEP_ID=MMETSP1353-20130828/16597_1 /TAXON_ID=1077150 /ORGANISM="Erythrolobus australicus, Strain CCMP3124" /LENGTH=103 /DNA_ID=CAMNT_0028540009 /DNA_START=21 /DNA_END=332 /DNA_ORIENTATION=-